MPLPAVDEAPPSADAPDLPASDSPGLPPDVPKQESPSLLPPEGLHVLASADGVVTLAWTKPAHSFGITYQVERSRGEDSFELVGTTADATFCDLDAVEGMGHTYRVFAIDMDGVLSADAAVVVVAPPTAMPPQLEIPTSYPQEPVE